MLNQIIIDNNNKYYNFESSYYASPGAEIAEWLEENQLNNLYLANQLHESIDFVNRLINANERITLSLANRLAFVTGLSAKYWLNRENHYREALHNN